ncbi:MAG: nucleotidyltransferase domain-containing protein [Bacillota bacterium]
MKTKTKYKLSSQQKKTILQKITNKLHVEQSILFAFVHGSFIEDELPFRDIDIAVYFDEKAAQKDLVDLCLELSVNLSALVGMPVDVHDLNTSKIGFIYEATSGKLLYTVDEELSYNFIENIRMKYYDLKPFWKDNLQDLLSSF